MQKRLIRRKKLVIDPKYVLVAPPGDDGRYTPLSPDHPVFALVGRISAAWIRVEQALDFCIGALADIEDPITACITAQMMGHAPRCLSIKALAHWRGLTEVEEFVATLNNELFDAADRRNRAIHDKFLVHGLDEKLFKDHRMSKKELHYGLKEYDYTELNKSISIIEQKLAKCHKLLEMIRDKVYFYEP